MSLYFDGHIIEAVTPGELLVYLVVGGHGPGVVAISVLIELDPQARERIGAVVCVGYDFGRSQHLLRRIELRMELVVRPVLPIVRPRRAVRGPVAVHRLRQCERSEGL